MSGANNNTAHLHIYQYRYEDLVIIDQAYLVAKADKVDSHFGRSRKPEGLLTRDASSGRSPRFLKRKLKFHKA